MYHNRFTNTMESIADITIQQEENVPCKQMCIREHPKKHNTKINMQCNVEKRHLYNVMNFILVECGLYVFGYDSKKDSFWGKKQNHLHFTLKIKNINSLTQINIKIIMDDHNQMKHVCEKIAELVHIYEDTFA